MSFSFSPSAAGQAAQFFHGADHDAVGNIGGDLHFSNFARQDKMHHAALRFLVGLQAGEDLASTHFELRQTAQAQYGIGDAACGHAVGTAYREGNVGGGDHSPGDGLAVEQAAVAGFRLKRVSDGVTQIKNAAQAAFVFVRRDHFSFQLNGLGDDPFELHEIALQDLGALLFEAQKEIEISDDSAFQRFVETCAKVAFGKSAQNLGINEDGARMVERSKQVLPRSEVDSRLAAD